MISLKKDQAISLRKEAPTLTIARMGLGWSGRKTGLFGRLLGGDGNGIDLDASALCYDAEGRSVEEVWFRRLTGTGITHSGDDRAGGGSGDNEVITVNLSSVKSNVRTIIFTVNSFSGESFESIEDAFVRLCDGTTGKEIARFTLSESGNHTGLIMCKLTREAHGWVLTAIGHTTSGRTFHDMHELRNYV